MTHSQRVGGAFGTSGMHRTTDREAPTEQPANPNCRPATAFMGVKILEGNRDKLADVCGKISFQLEGVGAAISSDIRSVMDGQKLPRGVEIPPACDTVIKIAVTPTYEETKQTPGTMIVEVNRRLWTALKQNGLRIASPFAHMQVGGLTGSYIYHTRAKTKGLTDIYPNKFLAALGNLLYQHERPDREDNFNFDTGTIFLDGRSIAIDLANDSYYDKFTLGAHHAMYKVNQTDPEIPFLRFKDEETENNWR